MTSTFNSYSQLSLMTSASTGYTAWNDLSSVRQISFQSWNIFVVDVFDFIHAERTNFFFCFFCCVCRFFQFFLFPWNLTSLKFKVCNYKDRIGLEWKIFFIFTDFFKILCTAAGISKACCRSILLERSCRRSS